MLQRQEVERLENEWKNIRLQLTEEIDQLKQLAHEREELFNETKQKLESVQQDNEASIVAKDQIIAELQCSLEQKVTPLDLCQNGAKLYFRKTTSIDCRRVCVEVLICCVAFVPTSNETFTPLKCIYWS